MSARQSRSASIPIPVSAAAARSLESAISLPFNASIAPRPRLASTSTNPSLNAARTIPLPARSGSSSYSSAVSSLPRERTSSTATPAPAFEPRIIRATSSPVASRDPACIPPFAPASPSAARPRRLSSTVRSQSAVSASPSHRIAPPAAQSIPHSQLHGFPRPPYLDYSSFRDLLHTDSPSLLSPSSRSANAYYAIAGAADTNATGSPAPPAIGYPYLRRELTPVVDSSEDESESYASSPPPAVGAVTYLSTNIVLRLPTRWSEQDRYPSLSISTDGRDLTFTGPPHAGDRESSSARTNYSIPPACGIYYYEVEILHRCPKGPISVGFSSSEVRLTRLPGWEKNSWGYHADDGWAFPGHKDGSPFGPTFDTGDVVGCGVDFSQHRVFFTKNGSLLGFVFENVGKDVDIYPSVGMRQTHESIRANFGHAPFRYSIEDHVRTRRDTVWGSVMGTPIDWRLLGLGPRKVEEGYKPEPLKVSEEQDDETRAPLRRLVLAYLAHHGYARTARAFQAQCARQARAMAEKDLVQPKVESVDDDAGVPMDTDVSPADSRDSSDYALDRELETRLSITNAILRGDIDTALHLTRTYHSSVLEREQGIILFRLRARKFVELVLQAGEALRRVKEAEAEKKQLDRLHSAASATAAGAHVDGAAEMDGAGAMDVDDPSPEAHPHLSTSATSVAVSPFPSPSGVALSAPTARASPAPSLSPSPVAALSALAKTALHTALAYGQTLEADYKADMRPLVRAHLRRTFGVVAFDDPCSAGGEVAEIAGQTARNALAAEVNQAILESQGRPAHPALETLFRQAGATVKQLGLLGCGSAAFVDVRREFLET